MSATARDVTDIIQSAQIEVERHHYQEALSEYNKLVDFYNQGERDAAMCEGFLRGGNCYMLLNNYLEAIKFYILALKEAERVDNSEVWNSCMSNIGVLYARMNNYPQARRYFSGAMDKAINEKDSVRAAVAISNLLLLSCKSQDATMARRYLWLNEHYPLPSKAENNFYRSYALGMIGKVDRNYDVALFYLSKANETVSINNLDPMTLIDIHQEEADIYRLQHQFDNASASLQRAIDIANSCDRYRLSELYKMMAAIYQESGDSEQAERYRNLFVETTDTSSEWHDYVMASDEINRYEKEMNDHHISTLKTTIDSRTMWLIITLVALCVFVAMLCVIVRYNRKLKLSFKTLIKNHDEISRQNELNRQRLQEILELKKKAPSSGTVELDQEQSLEIINNVNRVMEDIDVISNPDFSINELAGLVGSNPKYVSLALNSVYNKNFKTILTECRVREACRRLVDEEHYGNLTISAIAESVGYKAQSSLVLAFRKTIGMTPSEYKRESRKID